MNRRGEGDQNHPDLEKGEVVEVVQQGTKDGNVQETLQH
jgi:hypothetical protein